MLGETINLGQLQPIAAIGTFNDHIALRSSFNGLSKTKAENYLFSCIILQALLILKTLTSMDIG